MLLKCLSFVPSGISYAIQVAAIQISFSGIGVPLSLSLFQIAAYCSAIAELIFKIVQFEINP